MTDSARVTLDIVTGVAMLGHVTVAVREHGRQGELEVGGPGGPVLRPLSFGERSRAADRAAGAPEPRERLCAAILHAATVRPGQDDLVERPIQEVLALYLAGAGRDAPPFAEAALLVARAAGWDPGQLATADAAEVDRLATHLTHGQGRAERAPADSGWTRIVLTRDPADELLALRAELADDLLARSQPDALGPVGGDAPRDLRVWSSFAAGNGLPAAPDAPLDPFGPGHWDGWTANGGAPAESRSAPGDLDGDGAGTGDAAWSADLTLPQHRPGPRPPMHGDSPLAEIGTAGRPGETSPVGADAATGVAVSPLPWEFESGQHKASADGAQGRSASRLGIADPATAWTAADWADATPPNLAPWPFGPAGASGSAATPGRGWPADEPRGANTSGWPGPGNAPAGSGLPIAQDLADELAALLHAEADARGLD